MKCLLVTAPSGIGYAVWCSGLGPPVIMLHGFTGSHETWDHVAPLLSAGRQVVTLDLPGHGKSVLLPRVDWSFATVIDDLAWIIESRFAGEADLLGYSMGGRMALAVAVTHPDRLRRVILESASPGIANEDERQTRQRADEDLADRILCDGVDAFIASWERLPMWESQMSLPAAARDRQKSIRMGQSAAGLAASLRATGIGAQPSFWEQLANVTMPTLLITGELDAKFTRIAKAMHEAMPNSQVSIVQGAGHAVHLERPKSYAHLVSKFLGEPEVTAERMGGIHRD